MGRAESVRKSSIAKYMLDLAIEIDALTSFPAPLQHHKSYLNYIFRYHGTLQYRRLHGCVPSQLKNNLVVYHCAKQRTTTVVLFANAAIRTGRCCPSSWPETSSCDQYHPVSLLITFHKNCCRCNRRWWSYSQAQYCGLCGYRFGLAGWDTVTDVLRPSWCIA
jgi:hypothetical protein